jgi:hypothetical protein
MARPDGRADLMTAFREEEILCIQLLGHVEDMGGGVCLKRRTLLSVDDRERSRDEVLREKELELEELGVGYWGFAGIECVSRDS